MSMLFLKLVAALCADRLLGEPRRWHPLVGFGRFANLLETLTRRLLGDSVTAGAVAWLVAVVPAVAVAALLREAHPLAHWVTDIALLYFAVGAHSLAAHAQAITTPLELGRLDEARRAVSYIVSRDTADLSEAEVAAAGVESVLENGHDAIFGAIFWFMLLGGPGALLFRLANTLDAMWGYRNRRYALFGRVAARADDVLGWLPARLTALTYAMLGHTRNALTCWRTQAGAWKSPNAGPVMAAGAGALGVSLGGAARYHGETQARPPLGCGPVPDVLALTGALELTRRGMLLWVCVLGAVALVLALGGWAR
ncbi:adenosylcobinamide-phosphate synthase CbiB [Rhodocyclaceae bacterium SMB388]